MRELTILKARQNFKFCLALTVLIVLGLTANQACGKYGGGSGTAGYPYLIYTPEHMNAIGSNPVDWSKYFKLMADIDLGGLTGTAYNIIGVSGNPFRGTFDGNGHVISNFTYIDRGGMRLGVFGVCEGTIKNLGLVNPHVDGSTNTFDWGIGEDIGALVGSGGGNIRDCYVEGGSIAGNYEVGGLKGSNNGVMTDCYSTCDVSGFHNVGGLVGTNRGTISSCNATGKVTGAISHIGGLVGQNFESIDNCSTTGPVKSTSTDWVDVGGLVGYNNEGTISNCTSSSDITLKGKCGGCLVGTSWSGMITNCYATGSVTGTSSSYIGGLVGTIVTSTYYPYMGIIEFCYATGDVSGNNRVGGLVGESGSSIVRNCYATGAVSANNRVGGLMGVNYFYPYDGFDTAIIDKCYSTGRVTGFDQAGGLVGGYWPNPQIVINSFWDIQASGRTYSAGGTGKNTIQMKTKNTYTSAGWDFNTPIWTINEGNNYPRFWWESFPRSWSFEFAGFNVIERTRIGRTVFRYVLSLSLTNVTHSDITDIHIKLVNASEQVTNVIDGEIYFPLIEAYSTVDSNLYDDWFIIEVDRSEPITEGALTWRVDYTETAESKMQVMTARLPEIENIIVDGVVDFSDLAVLAEQWLGPPGDPSADVAPQPDGDGIVNFLDFAQLVENWQN